MRPQRQEYSLTSSFPLLRPYGKDVPRLDYWLAYENIMKKVGGRPHWAKVRRVCRSLTRGGSRAATVSQGFQQRAPLFPIVLPAQGSNLQGKP